MEDNYKSTEVPYLYGKVVITGVTGNNGFATLRKIRHLSGVTSIIGLVRNVSDIEKVSARLRAYDESTLSHRAIVPEITTDLTRTAHAHIWINWKGVNLATLKKINLRLETEVAQKGMHLRDMLLQQNLEIALDDANSALKYAPHCVYLQQGNPVDVILRAVQLLGFPAGKVLSTGAMMEFYRFTKLFSYTFREITLQRVTGLYIGEHGENAVPVRSRILFGGVTPKEYAKAIYGECEVAEIDTIYANVNREAFWIRERTGETPSEGPSSVTTNLVEMILAPQKHTVVGVASYIKENAHYDIADVGITLPVLIGHEGVVGVIEIELSEREKEAFKKAYHHLQDMNKIADTLLANR